MIKNLLCVIFLVIGAYIILARIIKNIRSNRKYTETVTALCVGANRQEVQSNQYVNGTEKNRTLYLPVLQYRYGGLEYTALPDELHNNVEIPKPGRQYIIKVNPYNPEEIYMPPAKLTAFNIIFGVVFIIIGLVLMVS